MYRHLIFDLDGTLLDTIEDICFAINEALRECGYAHRYDRESAKHLIGDGAEALIHRALKEKGEDVDALNKLRPIYMELYRVHQVERAKPYIGLKEVLIELKGRGFTFCCVTNKPDALAHTILDMHYGKGFFDEIIGASPSYPVKPDPTSTLDCIKRLGYKKEECLYVGDSHVDIATGHNAGLPVALCLWGYEVDYSRIRNDADILLSDPRDLLKLAS